MDPGEPALLFRNLPSEVRPGTGDRRVLRTFAADLSERVAAGRIFTCLITNDKALRKLNREFLGHDYATDVLSFPTAAAGELGDLVISAERAQAQAEAYGHTFLDELRVLMLHGVLHLVGFDHESDRGEMKREERKWRVAFNLPTTLIARVNGAGKR